MTPREARRHGIAVVQQELSLTASLSIAENIGLGDYPRRFGLVDYRALAARAKSVCELVGLKEPLSTPVGTLPLGRRQMVEIARALYRKPRVLILDEPTSSLSPQRDQHAHRPPRKTPHLDPRRLRHLCRHHPRRDPARHHHRVDHRGERLGGMAEHPLQLAGPRPSPCCRAGRPSAAELGRRLLTSGLGAHPGQHKFVGRHHGATGSSRRGYPR
jgi:hypothetical protein